VGVSAQQCRFCAILTGEAPGDLVLDEAAVAGLLDNRPLFPGHVLVLPRQHHETLSDLPPGLIEPVFSAARRVARALEETLGAEGTFVALNNRVSQSVPHLHVHVVPRHRGDGLRGFFWPRQRYESPEAMTAMARLLRSALERQI
jgi:histidine triad (HIT) family protein